MIKIEFMKKIILLLFLSLIFVGAVAQIPLIPSPQRYETIPAQFSLSKATIIIHDMELDEVAYYLQKELLRHENLPLTLTSDYEQAPASAISLRLNQLNSKQPVANEKESYSISMDAGLIVVEACHKKGIFNGIITLLQFIRFTEPINGTWQLQCYNIEDAPAYEWRGLMLDESRHFFGKEKVKQLIDWMALYKLNKFHWHLTDSPGWRIEILQYPKLAYVGGIGNHTNPHTPAKYYSQEEIKEIVKYASERQIDIIPEIDMPGHASAANRAYPEYSGGGSQKHPDFTFHPGKEEVYSYLTNILKEVDALFPSQIIHLGGDEVHFGNAKWHTDETILALMKREKLKEMSEVENYFFQRMSDSLFKMNNRLAAWDEIAESNLNPDKTIVYFWRQDKLQQLQTSLNKGYPIVMTPRLPMYLDYAQDSLHVHGVPANRSRVNSHDKIYNFDPYGYDVNYPLNSNILGVQVNVWTERIATENRLDYLIFPRIAALAETTWTRDNKKNISDFNGRLKKHLVLYEKDDIYYYNPFEPFKTAEPAK